MLKGSSLPTPIEETDISLEKLEQKLIQIHDENTEIIQRISAKVNSGVEISTFEYIIEPEKTAQSKRQPHKFTVKEVQHKQSVKAIVDVWTVPKEDDGLPQAPDPDELLYGKDKDFMDCSCVKFVDLVRINGHIEVAKKYTSMLRESLSIKFGRKFLHNFQAVNRLLHVVEALLSESSPSSLAEKRDDAVISLNEAAEAIFHQWENVSSVPDYISFANGSKEVTVTKATLHTVNKGTLLESGGSGVHTWKVRCDCKGQNEIPYDLGLLSPTYNTDSMGLGQYCSAVFLCPLEFSPYLSFFNFFLLRRKEKKPCRNLALTCPAIRLINCPQG